MAKARINLTYVKRSFKDGPFYPGHPGEKLPEAYKKFWFEWKRQPVQPVHYIAEEGNWKRNPLTGEVKPIQNVPLPLRFPKESEQQLWGGEGVIQGFQKRNRLKQRIPHFWVPKLLQSVVYSEILNKYMSVVMTERALNLIHKHGGLDHYILQTQACDLRSDLAIKLKQKLLSTLVKKEIGFADVEKNEKVYEDYKHYLMNYTEEEIEWYGLTFDEAVAKLKYEKTVSVQPLKHQYRLNLIQELLEQKNLSDSTSVAQKEQQTWLSKINPFSGK